MTQSDVNVILAELRFMNEKFDAQIKAREALDQVVRDHMASDDVAMKELDRIFIKKEVVHILLTTIGILSVMITSAWALIKFLSPLLNK